MVLVDCNLKISSRISEIQNSRISLTDRPTDVNAMLW